MSVEIIDRIKSGEPLTREHLETMAMQGMSLGEITDIKEEDLALLAHIGYELFNQGRIDDARVMFEGLEALGDTDPYIYTALGTIHARKDNPDRAMEYFNKSVELDPDDIAARVNRAEVLLQQNRFEDAAEDLKHAIELDPDEKDPLASRARVLVMVAHELMKSVQEGSA